MNLKKYNLLLFIPLLLITIIAGCNIYNPSEQIPSYIHIDHIDFTTDTSAQGSSSANISDAWVYIDDQLLGCFEMPTTFPVLASGIHKLTIRAGIKVNGIAATRSPYPFYKYYYQSVILKEGEITNVTPKTTYEDYTKFSFMENFEGTGIGMKKGNVSDTSLYIANNLTYDVFEGQYCGVAYLDDNHYKFECCTNDSIQLPGGQQPVFIEFNYKCNHNFVVSVDPFSIHGVYIYPRLAIIGYNASPVWKKAYAYVTPSISESVNGYWFKIYFGMVNYEQANGIYLAIDNVKIIH